MALGQEPDQLRTEPARRVICPRMAARSLKQSFRPGLISLRASWAPMALVIALCLATVVGYFFAPPVHRALLAAAEFRESAGFWIIPFSGFIAGALIPELARLLVGSLPPLDRAWLSKTFFTGFVYAVVAIMIFWLYRMQSLVFGDHPTPAIVGIKVVVDMLVFSPFVSIPFAVGMFKWRESGWRPAAWRAVFSWTGYGKNVMPALVMCWAYWAPIMAGLYALPERLQFVVAIFCQGAWSLLFVFMVGLEVDPPEVVPGVDAPPPP